MKSCLLLATLVAFTPVFGVNAPNHAGGSSPSSLFDGGETATALATAAAKDTKRHPLKGVITALYYDRSSIMVKHEEVPGVMRAMTMLFRVDDTTLKSVQKGQTITAMMSRQADEWWLHDVKVVAAAPGK